MATENQTMPETTATATPGISKELAAVINQSIKKIVAKRASIQRFEKYYNGEHEFNFASDKFTTKFAKRLKTMRDNLCKTVVRAPSDRLEIIGFGAEKDSDIYTKSWQIWKRSQMPRLAKRVHRAAFKVGDGFVLVWAGSDGNARLVPQDPAQCTVFYNPETQEVERGAKLWRGLDDYIYLSIYTREAIYKFVSKRTYKAGDVPQKVDAYEARQVQGETWPIRHKYDVCPLIHFGMEGSILDDVIPLNDALNKEMADMLIGSESNSLRQRWTAGIVYETDPETGKQIIPFDRAAQWFASQDPNAKFGDFTDVSLADFLAVIKDFRSEIASVAGIPHYYFQSAGDVPSGEALRKLESRFTATITEAQLDFGESWAQAMRLAMRIDGIEVEQADAAADEGVSDSPIETQWTAAAPYSDNEKLDMAIKKKSIGVSEKRNLSELGYSDADITAMQSETAKETADAANAFGKVFDAGGAVAS